MTNHTLRKIEDFFYRHLRLDKDLRKTHLKKTSKKEHPTVAKAFGKLRGGRFGKYFEKLLEIEKK